MFERWALVAMGIALASPAAWAQPTNAELEERLLGEVLSPILAAIEDYGQSTTIELLVRGQGTATSSVGEGVADFLQGRGYAASVRRGQSRLENGDLTLELQVEDAAFSQDRRRRNLLGLGAAKVQRQVDLVMDAQLLALGREEALFDARVEAHSAEWLDADAVEPLASDSLLPARSAAQRSNTAQSAAPVTSWTERGIALGLLSGVIVLYFSGIS